MEPASAKQKMQDEEDLEPLELRNTLQVFTSVRMFLCCCVASVCWVETSPT